MLDNESKKLQKFVFIGSLLLIVALVCTVGAFLLLQREFRAPIDTVDNQAKKAQNNDQYEI